MLGAVGGAAVQAFTGGRQIVLEAETLLEFRTSQPLRIDVPGTAGSVDAPPDESGAARTVTAPGEV